MTPGRCRVAYDSYIPKVDGDLRVNALTTGRRCGTGRQRWLPSPSDRILPRNIEQVLAQNSLSNAVRVNVHG